jgi:hypothetical protein
MEEEVVVAVDITVAEVVAAALTAIVKVQTIARRLRAAITVADHPKQKAEPMLKVVVVMEATAVTVVAVVNITVDKVLR